MYGINSNIHSRSLTNVPIVKKHDFYQNQDEQKDRRVLEFLQKKIKDLKIKQMHLNPMSMEYRFNENELEESYQLIRLVEEKLQESKIKLHQPFKLPQIDKNQKDQGKTFFGEELSIKGQFRIIFDQITGIPHTFTKIKLLFDFIDINGIDLSYKCNRYTSIYNTQQSTFQNNSCIMIDVQDIIDVDAKVKNFLYIEIQGITKNNDNSNIFKGWTIHNMRDQSFIQHGRFKMPIFSPLLDVDQFFSHNYIGFQDSFLFLRVMNIPKNMVKSSLIEEDLSLQKGDMNLYHLSHLHQRQLNTLFRQSRTFNQIIKPYFVDYLHGESNNFENDLQFYFEQVKPYIQEFMKKILRGYNLPIRYVKNVQKDKLANIKNKKKQNKEINDFLQKMWNEGLKPKKKKKYQANQQIKYQDEIDDDILSQGLENISVSSEEISQVDEQYDTEDIKTHNLPPFNIKDLERQKKDQQFRQVQEGMKLRTELDEDMCVGFILQEFTQWKNFIKKKLVVDCCIRLYDPKQKREVLKLIGRDKKYTVNKQIAIQRDFIPEENLSIYQFQVWFNISEKAIAKQIQQPLRKNVDLVVQIKTTKGFKIGYLVHPLIDGEGFVVQGNFQNELYGFNRKKKFSKQKVNYGIEYNYVPEEIFYEEVKRKKYEKALNQQLGQKDAEEEEEEDEFMESSSDTEIIDSYQQKLQNRTQVSQSSVQKSKYKRSTLNLKNDKDIQETEKDKSSEEDPEQNLKNEKMKVIQFDFSELQMSSKNKVEALFISIDFQYNDPTLHTQQTEDEPIILDRNFQALTKLQKMNITEQFQGLITINNEIYLKEQLQDKDINNLFVLIEIFDQNGKEIGHCPHQIFNVETQEIRKGKQVQKLAINNKIQEKTILKYEVQYYRPKKYQKKVQGDTCNLFLTPIQISNFYNLKPISNLHFHWALISEEGVLKDHLGYDIMGKNKDILHVYDKKQHITMDFKNNRIQLNIDIDHIYQVAFEQHNNRNVFLIFKFSKDDQEEFDIQSDVLWLLHPLILPDGHSFNQGNFQKELWKCPTMQIQNFDQKKIQKTKDLIEYEIYGEILEDEWEYQNETDSEDTDLEDEYTVSMKIIKVYDYDMDEEPIVYEVAFMADEDDYLKDFNGKLIKKDKNKQFKKEQQAEIVNIGETFKTDIPIQKIRKNLQDELNFILIQIKIYSRKNKDGSNDDIIGIYRHKLFKQPKMKINSGRFKEQLKDSIYQQEVQYSLEFEIYKVDI